MICLKVDYSSLANLLPLSHNLFKALGFLSNNIWYG